MRKQHDKGLSNTKPLAGRSWEGVSPPADTCIRRRDHSAGGFLFGQIKTRQRKDGVMQVKVDKEFKDLIPPLTQEEREGLEQSIIAEGCRESIIVWNGNIIDGHHRFEICSKHNLPFSTTEKQFDSREDVKVWMIDNQKHRRNLTDGWKFELAQERKRILAEKGKENRVEIGKKTGRGKVLSDSDKTFTPHDTRAEIAKELGWSTGKVAQADIVRKESPEIWEEVKKGEVAVTAAYNQIKRPHIANNSGENEWYTPAGYIEAARETMGSIDVDPACSEIANKTVKAKKFYTKETDGLTKKWTGNVWMNPPYAQPLIKHFCDAFCVKVESGEIKQGIVLVNNITETITGQKLMNASNAICFPAGRIQFLDKEGSPKGAPLQGQMILYFGGNKNNFEKQFSQFGICYKR